MTQEEVEQVFIDVMEIIRKRQMPLEMGYWMLGNAFCRFSQVLSRPTHQVVADIEIIHKTLPQPIEDTDEPNQ